MNHTRIRLYSSAQLVDDIPHLNYRKLDYWCRKGWLNAFDENQPGSGNRRAFTHREAQRASFLARLSKTGNKLLTKQVAEQTALPHENGELIYELPIMVDLGHNITVTIHPDNEWTRNVA